MLNFSPGSRWEGLDALGQEALQELRPRAEAAAVRGALLFVGELQRTLTGPRTGRVYRVSRTGALHVASAPGEPPAVLTGRLRQSITWTGPTWQGWAVEVEVGTNLVYGRRLEFGGVDERGVRILPRPWVEPTVLRVEPMLERLFESLV